MEKRESLSLVKNGKVKRCKSEKHLPSVAVSKERRMYIPDDPSKAWGDRLQIPGASTSGDQSRKVLQPDFPQQENPGLPPGVGLHLPGVQALGHGSHELPEWLQPLEEGLSGELPDSHNVVVVQPEVEKRKHLMM